jgi:hypothetical protein
MEINITNFLLLKNLSSNKDLEINTINFILSCFDNNDNKKTKKTSYKKNLNIQKNSKVKIIKDKISNKVKLILNKLSINNINNLVIEFIQNIKISSLEEYNEFLKTIYLKIISEFSFVKIYLEFLLYISSAYTKLLNYNISYFIDLIEIKFYSDYFNKEVNENIIESNDDNRINNLKLIREMISLEYLNNNIEQEINNKILLQTNYLSDIYYWFKNINIDNNIVASIKYILNNYQNIDIRDKILLQNIIGPYDIEHELEQEQTKKNKIIFKKKNILSFDDNIIELLHNYLVNDNYIIIKAFIECNCKEMSEKNHFSDIMINMYITNSYKGILDLIEELINNQVLYKSNISKSIINLHNNDPDIFNKNEQDLIYKLKILGITKNLDFLFEKQKSEIVI